MIGKKDTRWFENNMRYMQQQVSDFLQLRKKTNPRWETLKIIMIYLVLGGLWILLSDKVLGIFVKDAEAFKKIQLYKGWLYVVITGAIFYFIIGRKMMLFKIALEKIFEGYEELSAAHEELMAMEEEISQQFEELNRNRNALILSEQRYELAIEGAHDGIWDWDLETDTYFFSLKWKSVFGYEANELDNSLETWKKLFHPEDLERSLRAVEEYLAGKSGIYENIYRIRCKNGEYRWVLSRGKAVWDKEGKPIRIAGSHTDITEQRNMENKLHSLAYYDLLTQLPNRSMLEEIVNKQLQQTEIEDKKIAFIYFDIDDFKHVNDTMGHGVGDQLIVQISNILTGHIQAPNIVARLSGDEFAILLVNIENENAIIREIERVLASLRKPWILDNQEFFISASIGIAIYPEHGTDLATLLQNADTALFHVKEHGKDGYCIYTPEMREKTWKYIQMSNQLRVAIQNHEFSLYYQPQIDLRSNKIMGVEALIRWIHPEKGFISPMEFIPFAEETGHIAKIEEWVLKTACKQKKIWEKQGYANLKMSVNLSGKMLTHEDLVPKIHQMLVENHINCCDIELEITETAVMADLEKAIRVLEKLKKLGLTIALDDFGTGYSSLTYLQKLPIDILKVDREFIKNIVDEDEESYIFKSVVDLAHNLGLKVVAEGVETKEQLAFLRKNGCDIAQGYYFSKPIPASDMEILLKENKKEF